MDGHLIGGRRAVGVQKLATTLIACFKGIKGCQAPLIDTLSSVSESLCAGPSQIRSCPLARALITDVDVSLQAFKGAEGASFLNRCGGLVATRVAPALNRGIGLGHAFQIGGAFQRVLRGYEKAVFTDQAPAGRPSLSTNRRKLFDQAHWPPVGCQVGGRCGLCCREGGGRYRHSLAIIELW